MQAFAIEACKSLALGLVWPALLHSVWLGLLVAAWSHSHFRAARGFRISALRNLAERTIALDTGSDCRGGFVAGNCEPNEREWAQARVYARDDDRGERTSRWNRVGTKRRRYRRARPEPARAIMAQTGSPTIVLSSSSTSDQPGLLS